VGSSTAKATRDGEREGLMRQDVRAGLALRDQDVHVGVVLHVLDEELPAVRER